jgi:hypothetical protein
LVEDVPWNLFTYSNDFSNAAWTKNNTLLTGGQSDPFGGTNAWKFESILAAQADFRQTVNGANSYSFYAKAGNISEFRLWNGVAGTIFNITNGTIVSGTGTTESVGDGWYRCTVLTSTTGSVTLIPYFAAGAGDFVYIAFGQAQASTTAKPYFPTTDRLNVPRLTYQNGGGGCPSLLLEPQRTNISNFIESGTGNFLAATVTSATSILGLTTFNVVSDGVLYGDSPYILTNLEFQANGTYTCSFYTDFTHCTGTTISCNLLGFFPTVAFAVININKTTKAITSNNVGGVWTINSSSATQINNEIYRISFTVTPNATSVGGSRSYIFGDLAGRFAGAQVEIGSYPTSFINKPTGSSVTRNADACSKTGISSLIGQTEGTMFVDVDLTHSNLTGANEYLMQIYETSSQRILLYRTAANQLAYYFLNGSTIFNYSSSITTNGRHKLAFAYKSGDSAFYIDGVQSATNSTSFSAFSNLNELQIGANFNPTQAEIGDYNYNQAILFPTRLTNAQLASITTL